MKTQLAIIAALAVTLTHSTASFIDGEIHMDTLIATDTGDVENATGITDFLAAEVSNGSGVFSGTAGASVTGYPFSFAPFIGPTKLWDFTSGGKDYSFTATDVTVDFQTSFVMILKGEGVVSISGSPDRFGTYEMVASRGGASTTQFTYSVPDEPSHAMLIGVGLCGLAGLRRFRRS